MIGNIARASILALAVTASTAGVAAAGTPYDGRWSLSIVTQHGACDTYNFPVNIANGAVTFPGLVKASGRVTAKGGVRVADYHANLIFNSGGGTALELRQLIDELKLRVFEKFGFQLEEEVQYIGLY